MHSIEVEVSLRECEHQSHCLASLTLVLRLVEAAAVEVVPLLSFVDL
jgi:hypothetical protein